MLHSIIYIVLFIYGIFAILSTVKYMKSYLDNYCYKPKIGILFRLQSFWIGAHYSIACKRLCINLVPCVTIWIILKDGKAPDKKLM